MAVQSKNQRGFHPGGHALAGLVIGIFCSATWQPSVAFFHRVICNLGGEVARAVLCLLLAEGRLLASHVLNFEKLLDCYGLLATVLPLLHCMLGLR